jgi:membrane-associated phospholipid phosphatase
MFTFEWIALVYFSGMLLTGAVITAARRGVVLAGMAIVGVLALAIATPAPRGVRLWLPLGYLVAGYWLPALMVRGRTGVGPSPGFEAWLARSDAALRPWLPQMPAWLVPITELAYLFCYPLVPIAFALAWTRGTPQELDRFWAAVLLAGFASYVALPWLLSRPPRATLRAPADPRGLRGVNTFVLGRVSHGWNTFPSGHVAVSWAAAVSLAQIWPEAGAIVALLAAAIAVGAAAGGYHYVVDIAAGWLTAVVAAVITW